MSNYLIGTDPTLRKTKTPTVTTLTAGVGFTAGTSTAITLGADPGQEEHVIVTMDGVTQHRSTYSVSGTTLTFDAAIPTGTAEIEATFGVPVSSVTVPDDAITLAKMADNAVGLAQMAGGTDGNIISYDSSGDPVAIATGNDGQVLTSAGAGAQPAFETLTAGFTQSAVTATTSGTSHTISGIPSGTKLIYFIINGVNFTGHLDMDITIGDSGGLETSGYTSVSQESNAAATLATGAGGTGSKWELYNSNSTSDYAMLGVGMIHLVNPSTFLYNFNYQGGRGRGLTLVSMTGDKTLSAEITQVSIAGGTFDEGQFCLMYI